MVFGKKCVGDTVYFIDQYFKAQLKYYDLVLFEPRYLFPP